MADVDGQLATAWLDLLACGHVSGDADFFECGGSSIAAVHLAATIQETFGVPVDAIEVVTLRRFSEISALIISRLDEVAPKPRG